MKKTFFAIALCAVALVSCEKDKTVDSPEKDGYMPLEEQKTVINSSIQQALQSYDLSSMAPVISHLGDFNSNIMMETLDSMMSNPVFNQVISDFIGKEESAPSDNFKFKMSVRLTDNIEIEDGDTTIIVTPSVTCEKTSDHLNSIDIIHGDKRTGMKFGTFGDSFSFGNSDDNDGITFPDSLYLSIKYNEMPAYELSVSNRTDKAGKLSVSLESKFDKFGAKYSIRTKEDGIALNIVSFENSRQLFSLNGAIDCDLNSFSTESNELLAWLLDYTKCRGISYSLGVLNDKVKLETTLSNPAADSRIISNLLSIAEMETLPNDKATELYNLITPFAKSEFVFDGYRNPQAGVVLFGGSEPNGAAISNMFAAGKILSAAAKKLIEAVKTKESMIMISTVMSLYPKVVDTIKSIDMDSHIHVYAENVKDEQYIPVDEYIDTKSISSLIFKPIVGMFDDMNIESSASEILMTVIMAVSKIHSYLN